mmetsp:Transcript_17165/g.29124  ORF Transcript_17165/g.29124 Transcript_17165/m.29124 type:complete len:87 (+) Transcript_17165:113-373(+)
MPKPKPKIDELEPHEDSQETEFAIDRQLVTREDLQADTNLYDIRDRCSSPSCLMRNSKKEQTENSVCEITTRHQLPITFPVLSRWF